MGSHGHAGRRSRPRPRRATRCRAPPSWRRRRRSAERRRQPARRRAMLPAPRPRSPSAAPAVRGASLSSCVISTRTPCRSRRPASESAEKPPKTTVCGAPSRAQASIATGSSGPCPCRCRPACPLHPERSRPLAERTTSRWSSAYVMSRRSSLGLALPVVGDLVAEAGLDVAVHAVVRDVELAAQEPLRVRGLPLQHRVERLEPTHALTRLAPQNSSSGTS